MTTWRRLWCLSPQGILTLSVVVVGWEISGLAIFGALTMLLGGLPWPLLGVAIPLLGVPIIYAGAVVYIYFRARYRQDFSPTDGRSARL